MEKNDLVGIHGESFERVLHSFSRSNRALGISLWTTLLMMAAEKAHDQNGYFLQRGQLWLDRRKTAQTLGVTESKLGTAMNHLHRIGEIAYTTKIRGGKYIITMINYNTCFKTYESQ